MDHLFACSCGEVLVKSSTAGVTKVRNKILVFRDGNAYAVCPRCDKENPVPIKLNESEIAKALEQPRLFLKERPKLIVDMRSEKK